MIRNNIYKIIIAFLFLVLTWLMLFNYGHCASDQDYFPMHQNKNGKFTEPLINYIENTLNSNDNYIFCSYLGIGNPNSPNYKTYEFLYISIPKNSNTMLYGEKNNDLIHFSLYKIGSANPTGGYIKYNPHFGTFDNLTYNGILNYFQNLTSSNYDNSKDYVSNFQVMTNNTESAKVVLFYDDGITVPEGDTARDDMEKPDSSDYFPDWTNAPTFDNSSVENALQSIFNYFVWFGGNIKGTIEGLGNFIGDTVRWSIQKVLDRISDTASSLLSGIQNKINDVITSIGGKIDSFTGKLEHLYEGFTDFADLFIHPFDEEEYEEQIANCELISQYDQLIENCEDIQAIFNNATERDSFVLYIDFENPFADAQHKFITSEISFNWLVPLRSVYRPFLWVFTLVELFTGSMRLLGNIIGGKGK